MATTPKSQWEYIYQSIPVSQIPWETGEPAADILDLIKNKALTTRMKVLDVGCGLGTQTRFLAQRGIAATGLDISETAVKKAREQLLKDIDTITYTAAANFVVGDACKMPFSTASFDFVYDRGCYHHLNPRQRREYAKEVTRVLQPKGVLHMLIFAGTMSPIEVIEYFLPHFRVQEAYEDKVVDRTNNDQEIPVHIVHFRKLT
jgi:SAM-dependent methyltransferase